MRKIYPLLFMLFCLASYADDMDIDHVNTDLYPPETLAGKGVLLFGKDPIEQLKLDTHIGLYDQDSNEPKLSLYIDGDLWGIAARGTKPQHYFAWTNPLHVFSQDDRFYWISASASPFMFPEYKRGNYMDRPWIKVDKKEILALGFNYISLDKILEAFNANDYWAADLIGYPVAPREFAPATENGKTDKQLREADWKKSFFVLRTRPEPEAPFVKIEGYIAPNEYQVLSKKGYWYELQMKMRFYTDPPPDADDNVYRGWWRAPCDENGFPSFLPHMVMTGRWRDIAEWP